MIALDQRVQSSGAQLDSSLVLGDTIEVRTTGVLITKLYKPKSVVKSVAVKIDADGSEFNVLLGDKATSRGARNSFNFG